MSYSKPIVQSVHFASFKSYLPRMDGKTIVITGTTSGTGSIAANVMVELGGKILLLNRPSTRSKNAYENLKSNFPNAEIHAVDCDLQSFDSVRSAIQKVKALCPEGIHVLSNNAGVMALEDVPTVDGYDIQMQTNHLSHFLLTAELMSLLEKAGNESGDARIVNHSSVARFGKKLEAKYLEKNGGKLGGNGASMLFGGGRWVRYQQTKLANAAFTAALHQKLQAKDSKVKALVAHPGLANTNLQITSVQEGGMPNNLFTKMFMKLSQSEEDGAMGLISAMCLPDAQSGQFYGPGKGMMALKGEVKPFALEPLYDNQETRTLLWEKSNDAVGLNFNI